MSPQNSLGETLTDVGWDQLEDAPIIHEQGVKVTKAVADEEIEAGGGDTYLTPQGMPEPCMPAVPTPISTISRTYPTEAGASPVSLHVAMLSHAS